MISGGSGPVTAALSVWDAHKGLTCLLPSLQLCLPCLTELSISQPASCTHSPVFLMITSPQALTHHRRRWKCDFFSHCLTYNFRLLFISLYLYNVLSTNAFRRCSKFLNRIHGSHLKYIDKKGETVTLRGMINTERAVQTGSGCCPFYSLHWVSPCSTAQLHRRCWKPLSRNWFVRLSFSLMTLSFSSSFVNPLLAGNSTWQVWFLFLCWGERQSSELAAALVV